MATRKEVKSYFVNVAAHLDGFNEWRTEINLHDENGVSFGTIRFTDKLASKNNEINPTGHSTMWAPTETYDWVLDILRNEKPVFMWLYNSGQALVSTTAEPVGEEETGT